MFDRVSFSDDVLLFHTAASADQAGAVTTLRQAGVVFTSDSVSLGKYGPFALPSEIRDAREFQKLMALSDNTVRLSGKSKAPRSRPDWPILSYAYRLYAAHTGVARRCHCMCFEQELVMIELPGKSGILNPISTK